MSATSKPLAAPAFLGRSSRRRRGGGQSALGALADKAANTAPSLRVEPQSPSMGHALLHRAVAFAAAMALFCGVGALVLQVFGIEAGQANPVACVVVAALVVAASCALYGLGKRELIGFAIMAGVLLVLGIVLSGAIAQGGAAALNSLDLVLGQRSNVYDIPYATTDGSFAVFACFCSALLAAACAQMALRGGTVACLVLAAVLVALVAFGFAQVNGWTALLALGIVACFCTNSVVAGNVADGRALLVGAAAVLVPAALLCGLLAAGAGTLDTSSQRTWLEQLYYGIVYGDAAFAMPEGKLNDLGARSSSQRGALQVTTSADTNEYLRGFVGEAYANGEWKALSADEVVAHNDLFYWLGRDGFDANAQLGTAAQSVEFDQTSDASIEIEAAGARGGYAYLPYGYVSGSAHTTTTDLAMTIAQKPADDASTQLAFDSTLLRKSYLLQEQIVANQEQEGASALAQYLRDESGYRSFVYSNYLSIPATVADTFEEMFGRAWQFTPEEAKAQILQELEGVVTYDTTVSTRNNDKDFVSYFLEDQQKGYDVHYATTATLLMRYYGVPARYVEGYRLDTEELDKAASEAAQPSFQGSQAESAQGASQAAKGGYHITEQNAHAWVEYYLDGVGWIPFEVTPGQIDYSFYELSDSLSMQMQGSASRDSSESSSVWMPEIEEPEPEPEPEPPSTISEVLRASSAMWPWALLGFVLTVLVGMVVRSVVLRRRLARFNESLATAAPSQAVPAAFSYALFLGNKVAGCPLGNAPFSQQRGYVERGLCSRETYAKSLGANARALFSEQQVSEADRHAVLDMVGQMRQALSRQLNPFQRFYQRWIRCVY